MLSKFLPWDFVLKFPQVINPKEKGLYSFYADEAYVEKMLMDLLPKKDISFSLYSGAEITKDFIEEHFLNLSFFSQTENIIVMGAESISQECLELLLQVDLSDKYVVLFFSKVGKTYNEFVKNKNVFATTIESPRFWDGPVLWQFCLKIKSMRNDSAVTQFALSNLEHNFDSFMRFIDIISLQFPDGKIDPKKLPELIEKERWDFFEMVNLFHRGPKFLFSELVHKDEDLQWWIGFCAQMQNHLSKLLYPQEIRQKAKPNKYEQSILQLSEKLDRAMLKYYLDYFLELDLLAKSKVQNEFLINTVRLELLRLN
jgi:hypothetical protein